jgi:hypothetical protein
MFRLVGWAITNFFRPRSALIAGNLCLRHQLLVLQRRWARLREGSPSWRSLLRRYGADIWACDFFCVQSLWSQTLYVFFVIHHASREVVHIRVTQHSTAEWMAEDPGMLQMGPGAPALSHP